MKGLAGSSGGVQPADRAGRSGAGESVFPRGRLPDRSGDQALFEQGYSVLSGFFSICPVWQKLHRGGFWSPDR